MTGQCNVCGIDFIADDDSHICGTPICPQCGEEHERLIFSEIGSLEMEAL